MNASLAFAAALWAPTLVTGLSLSRQDDIGRIRRAIEQRGLGHALDPFEVERKLSSMSDEDLDRLADELDHTPSSLMHPLTVLGGALILGILLVLLARRPH